MLPSGVFYWRVRLLSKEINKSVVNSSDIYEFKLIKPEIIKLKDGSSIDGVILRREKYKIVIETKDGIKKLNIDKIRKIKIDK